MLLKCSLGAPRRGPGGCGLLPCGLRRRLASPMACRGDIQPASLRAGFSCAAAAPSSLVPHGLGSDTVCSNNVRCLQLLVFRMPRAPLCAHDGRLERPWQNVSLADGWLRAPFSRRRTRGTAVQKEIEAGPRTQKTQIVCRLPCARPSRQAHSRELPEDVLGRRRATTSQQLPRWCENAAQFS